MAKARSECNSHRFFKQFRYIFKLYFIYKDMLKYIKEIPFFALLEDFAQFLILHKETYSVDTAIKNSTYKAWVLGGKVGCVSIVNTKDNRSFLTTFTIDKFKEINKVRCEYTDFSLETLESNNLESKVYHTDIVKVGDMEQIIPPTTKIVYDNFNEDLRFLIKYVVASFIYNTEV